MHNELADEPKAVFLANLARELHHAGMATDVLEGTLTDIAESIGIPLQIFALPTYITMAFGDRWDQKIVMIRVPPGSVDLQKISRLNEIYRQLRGGDIDYRRAGELLDELDGKHAQKRSPLYQIPALGLVALGVSLLLGGSLNETIVAACIGLSTGILSVFTGNQIVARLYEVVAALVGTLIVGLATRLLGPVNIYICIVAGVVVLLPGFSLTLALHELANSDLVAGVARLGKVLSTLLALGCGALLGFALLGPMRLDDSEFVPHAVGVFQWMIAAGCMAIGTSIELNARWRDFIWVFAASFVALATSHILGGTPVHQVAGFASAFICGIVANLGARLLRLPPAVMLVPALLVLVPGSLSYESVLFAFQHNISTALTFGANAASAAVQLVAGLLFSQLLFPTNALQAAPGTSNMR